MRLNSPDVPAAPTSTLSRHQLYLRERYRVLIGYGGTLATVTGIMYLVPLLLLVFYPEEIVYAPGFLIAGIPLIVGGLFLRLRFLPDEPLSLSVQEGSVVVSMIWLTAILTGAIPLMFHADLNLMQAIFESTSGWTATGLTVVDVTTAPKLILFLRSFIQLMGAAGFVIIALSAVAGSFSAGLVSAEGRTDQLAPSVRRSSNIVLRIYSAYVILGVIALLIAGMDLFDAINHSFAAVATGGFSTRVGSIGEFDSAAIEGVIIVLMILGTINFFVAYTFLRGKFRAFARSGEIRIMIVQFVGGVVVLLFMATQLYPSFDRALRASVFEATSALTTAGFATVDYRTWTDFGWMILIILMMTGGGTGSTAGGIKQLRIYILYKAIVWEVRKAFMPRHMVNEPAIWRGDQRERLNDKQVRQVALFAALYLAVFVLGTGITIAYGYALDEGMFEFASALANAGLSIGITSPDMPAGLMFVMSVGMLLGRLEFFALIVGLIKFGTDAHAMVRASRRVRRGKRSSRINNPK